MTVFSENKHLQSQLENLIALHETDINYFPVEIELDPDHISENDIEALLLFVSLERKRLFIFKLPNDEQTTSKLSFTARRFFLNRTAETILQSTSSEPKINPLKKDLHTPPSTVRAAIQIQKSIVLPKPPIAFRGEQNEYIQQIAVPDLILVPLELLKLPMLAKQLDVLGIRSIQDTALQIINEHSYAFTDGIIPNNLPKGFYIIPEEQALCYTDTPQRLPSALAPVLAKTTLVSLPTIEQAQVLLPTVARTTIEHLLDNSNQVAQKNALLMVFPLHAKEITSFLNSLKPAELDFIVPLLATLFILGGEAHTRLFVQLLKTAINKKLSIEFLKDPEAQDAFLSPRGIKNFQKLLQLPAEQREWWDTLTIAHCQNEEHQFDFNTFFEAYTQIFLPQIAENNLTLPQPCPIQHKGHFLITLNRVIDVLGKAQNPQEQCLNLAGLNWSPTGVHYAMLQAPEIERFKQVASCMKLENPEDTVLTLENIYQHIENEEFDLSPWLFRYMGQHWKTEIRLADIQAQLEEIQNIPGWSTIQKNQLSFILTCSFSQESPLRADNWKKTLKNCISLLQPLEEVVRIDLIQALSRCYNFKPGPSLVQIQYLIEQSLELKTAFSDLDFKNELLNPLIACLENEGFELINTLQERVQKIDQSSIVNQATLATIVSFTTMLQNNRQVLHPDFIKLLAALNESELNQGHINNLRLAIENLQTKKGEAFCEVLLSLLAKINISKSQSLPTAQQCQELLATIADSPITLPIEHRAIDQQEKWLKDLIIGDNLLPGCVLGNGDISKLDDLIVDALTDAIKKRAGVLNVAGLKYSLDKVLQYSIVPKDLREQLHRELWPLFDALEELITLLQNPNPKFEEILAKFRFFEERKTTLLEGNYSVGVLGESKGEYLLSYLLSGKRKEADNITGKLFSALLPKVHNLIASEIHAFFNDEHSRNIVKDLDAHTTLNWLATFNDTLSITFLFKEELIQKKVLPALKKTLVQLNTQDPDFENSILQAAADLAEDKPSDYALQDYKIKIESIASYLNLLIDIKDQFSIQFSVIYKQLHTGFLTRLNYKQKQTLIRNLLAANPQSLDLYLKLISSALEDNPEADEAAIDRAINGLSALFELTDLEPETQIMFFKMSMAHNLKNPSPFPLAMLNELKNSHLDEEAKSLIIKQIIQILSHKTDIDSPELVESLIQQTQAFLTENSKQASLCIALLKRISLNEFNRDVGAYSNILHQLSLLSRENRDKLVIILSGLARNQKDASVNLLTILDITKGLGRRTSDLEEVLQLFITPPYPTAQRLNSALLAHDSEKLQAYCQSFDTNPFANSGETRALAQQFASDRIEKALINLSDLMHDITLPHKLQLKLARQLNYIETLGYTDPLDPHDFQDLKKLTASSRHDLKERASTLLNQLRSNEIPAQLIKLTQLELLAYFREIYFRTTGLFPNSTQMLVLLLSLRAPYTNLLMSIKTGEGKSLITPIFATLQWAQGGTVEVCTANKTLLDSEYENSCEPFFNFLGIKSALIHDDSRPEDYQLGGINCSTVEDMSLFRLAAKEARKEEFIQNEEPIHLILDECDDALLDQTTLYKLVAQNVFSEEKEDNPAQWVYALAYQFIKLPGFRNIDPAIGKIWDEEKDLEEFRLFINKEINEKFNGDADKQNFIMAASNTQLKQWIHASCKAATLIENKHFITCPIKEKDETGNEITKKIVCVPLVKRTPKTGSIFPDGVQQALQARLIAERKEQARYFFIDADPFVLASQSAQGLIRFYQDTKGRIFGISGTPGDPIELQYLATLYGAQAIGVNPHAGDKRIKHPPIFTFSRTETMDAIHRAIDNIKRPITKPSLEFEADTPIQTLEEREAFILQTQKARQKWSLTQTQPILIYSEDFDEAQTIGLSFESYKKAGFTIQIVTGKESPEELEQILIRAGQVNTISIIGTGALNRGINIDPEHPDGLLVIQPYADSERITTQIAGRAARNGKTGQWLPIYRLDPPQNWLQRIMYFVFPWYRQQKCQKAIENLQTEIKLQSTVDRLYTQAIDHAQRTLMQQVQAWESLELELYPTDAKLQYELYQWREALLTEVNHAQETCISPSTLESSITQFQNAICKIWESAKEEKWARRAQNATVITAEQGLRLNYLKQLDLTQELKIQTALEQKSAPLKAGTKALIHQNLKAMILDKAGAVLEFTTPTEEERTKLELAQSKQLLPYLIGELCGFYPQAIEELSSESEHQMPSFLLEILNSLVNKIIKQKNNALLGIKDRKQITKSIIQFYQNELKQADADAIQALLIKIKPLILIHNEAVTEVSLVDKFKMQGLILTFSKLYENSGLPNDNQVSELKTIYGDEIMKMLAEHLLNEFAWVKASPAPFHAFLERTVVKEAAHAVYDLAEELRQSPGDEEKIHALYTCLQEQRVMLQDKYLFSVRHSNPRQVIATALAAIESLNIAPHCDKEFQDSCHDAVLSTYHLTQFHSCLEKVSLSLKKAQDPVWDHLKDALMTLSKTNENQIHVIAELYDAVERFGTYAAYLPYKNQLRTMKAQLSQSMTALKKADGLKQDYQDTLFAQKTAQFASLLEIEEGQIRIQRGCDSKQFYIEMQVENAPLLEGFTGYEPSYLPNLENERRRITQQQANLARNREALIELADIEALEEVPLATKSQFEKLFQLKTLLNEDWRNGFDIEIIEELPVPIQALYEHIQKLKQWTWPTTVVETEQLQMTFVDNFKDIPVELFGEYEKYCNELQGIQSRKREANQIVEEKKGVISSKENQILAFNKRLLESDCGFSEKVSINAQLMAIKAELIFLKPKLSEPVEKLDKITKEEGVHLEILGKLIRILDSKKEEFVAAHEIQAKLGLKKYLHETSEKLFVALEQEFNEIDSKIEQLTQLEGKKSRYQTRRFSDVSELLRYDASLRQEQGQIPNRPEQERTTLNNLIRPFFSKTEHLPVESPALARVSMTSN